MAGREARVPAATATDPAALADPPVRVARPAVIDAWSTEASTDARALDRSLEPGKGIAAPGDREERGIVPIQRGRRARSRLTSSRTTRRSWLAAGQSRKPSQLGAK
jgi:hypothetical protein